MRVSGPWSREGEIDNTGYFGGASQTRSVIGPLDAWYMTASIAAPVASCPVRAGKVIRSMIVKCFGAHGASGQY